jgi:hypothetical protein
MRASERRTVTTSGTYLFNPSADDLLQEAWERLGKNPAELTGDVARAARRSLAYIQIEWTNRGLNLWQVDSQTLATVAATSSYTLASATIEPLDVSVTVSGIERTLSPIGRTDYAAIPTKSLAGVPTQYWAERQRDQTVLHLYPTPDAAYTVTYYRMREPQDVSALGQTLDAPMLWMDALAGGLAARLAVKYAPDRLGVLGPIYDAAIAAASRENRQRTPLKLGIRRSA